MSLTNKVAIITGGSAGIGAAIAILFAKEGANVSLVGRNENKLKEIQEKCNEYSETLIIKADVSKDEDAERIINETKEKFGKIDILVNNAAIIVWGSVLDGNIVKGYDETLSVNTRAAIQLTTLAAPYIIETKGNIINISSTAADQVPEVSIFIPYCISKIALEHFTKGAALEFSTKGVRVNCIRPGPVRTEILDKHGFDTNNWKKFTELTALNRVSEPEEIADLTLYVASDKAKGITGSIFTVDNGYLLKN